MIETIEELEAYEKECYDKLNPDLNVWYLLSKQSLPSSWELITDSFDKVLATIRKGVCEECMEDIETSEPELSRYSAMSKQDKLYHLLGSSCGCEYGLYTFETREQLIKEL